MVNPSTQNPADPLLLSPKVQFEQEKMTDVSFLLETLFIREESTVKQIIDCLYDIGSLNLIDQRVRRRPLNRIAKWAARFSKPVFRIIALRWFKRNCPRLITNWLYTQVRFEPQKVAQVIEAAQAQTDELTKVALLVDATQRTIPALGEIGFPSEQLLADQIPVPADQIPGIDLLADPLPADPLLRANFSAELESYRQEVRLLHSRVKWLTTLLIGVTVALGGGLIWSVQRDQIRPAQFSKFVRVDLR